MKQIALKIKLDQCLPLSNIKLKGKQYRIIKGFEDVNIGHIKLLGDNGVEPILIEEAKNIDCLLISGPFNYTANKQNKIMVRKLWFVYGNNGKKSSNLGHKLYQSFIEHSSWMPCLGQYTITPDMEMFIDFIKAIDMEYEVVNVKA